MLIDVTFLKSMLPKIFKPQNKYNLIRLWRDNDGGYLIEENSLLEANSLLSFGLSYDWSFEKKFLVLKDVQYIATTQL